MILSKEYNRALWLMIEFNKEDRDNIIDLINDIPGELYDRIRYCLYNLYKSNNGISCMNLDYLCGDVIVDNKMYYYRIDNHNYCLSFGRSNKEADTYNKEVKLCLNCVSKDKLLDNYSLSIGSIQYNNFDVRKLCLGDNVKSWDYCRYVLVTNNYGNIQNIDIVNVNNIPDTLDNINLSNDNMFVRKRG